MVVLKERTGFSPAVQHVAFAVLTRAMVVLGVVAVRRVLVKEGKDCFWHSPPNRDRCITPGPAGRNTLRAKSAWGNRNSLLWEQKTGGIIGWVALISR